MITVEYPTERHRRQCSARAVAAPRAAATAASCRPATRHATTKHPSPSPPPRTATARAAAARAKPARTAAAAATAADAAASRTASARAAASRVAAAAARAAATVRAAFTAARRVPPQPVELRREVLTPARAARGGACLRRPRAGGEATRRSGGADNDEFVNEQLGGLGAREEDDLRIQYMVFGLCVPRAARRPSTAAASRHCSTTYYGFEDRLTL